MDAEKLNQAQTDKMALQEAVYLVDRAVLLYLKEVQSGDFEYAVFDKQTKGKVTEGRIMEDNVLDGIDPTHDHLAAARDAAIKEAGLDGIEAAQVGLTPFRTFIAAPFGNRTLCQRTIFVLSTAAITSSSASLMAVQSRWSTRTGYLPPYVSTSTITTSISGAKSIIYASLPRFWSAAAVSAARSRCWRQTEPHGRLAGGVISLWSAAQAIGITVSLTRIST